MIPQIAPARPEEEAILRALFELYAYDLSVALSIDVSDDGRFHPPALGPYWTDPLRHPFLFRVEGKLAGFALVGRTSRLSHDESIFDMAEFFVLRKYRLQRIGERAAHALFDRFPARWEVRQKRANTTATAFWRRVIGRYGAGRFVEVVVDDERWQGPVQCFDSAENRVAR